MAELFPSQPESLENTVKIADRCNVSFEFGKTKLPYFHIDGVSDNEKFLRDMCMKGLYKRYENPTKEALKRILIITPLAPSIAVSRSGLEIAFEAATFALSLPEALPIPI